MGTLTVGSIVTVPFPYTDLTNAKKRPAIVLAMHGRNDYILCAVTSQNHIHLPRISILESDIDQGYLKKDESFAVYSKILTANRDILNPVAKLTSSKISEILNAVRDLF
ncbi:type II toxin-antitoxin system PemK/MazF family toxin [Desulfovibrio sp. JC010]|uniref:type II toxin-antitoxin system PemK/MazF family toxin n=1 Tax=Desulfovibrio sp. JC010 TaxID=2593641 RepID=UPI0013D69EDC|nr:type II toxin-antitoxin system PemK/MazF family toxin [Desulfovibrio sp. JC010]NDV27273.1 type II toxin-antitoxin system PemK/MazF family toxin [Desulfovibrio sp. JC010]